MKNKLILSVGTTLMIVAPMATVIACSDANTNQGAPATTEAQIEAWLSSENVVVPGTSRAVISLLDQRQVLTPAPFDNATVAKNLGLDKITVEGQDRSLAFNNIPSNLSLKYTFKRRVATVDGTSNETTSVPISPRVKQKYIFTIYAHSTMPTLNYSKEYIILSSDESMAQEDRDVAEVVAKIKGYIKAAWSSPNVNTQDVNSTKRNADIPESITDAPLTASVISSDMGVTITASQTPWPTDLKGTTVKYSFEKKAATEKNHVMTITVSKPGANDDVSFIVNLKDEDQREAAAMVPILNAEKARIDKLTGAALQVEEGTSFTDGANISSGQAFEAVAAKLNLTNSRITYSMTVTDSVPMGGANVTIKLASKMVPGVFVESIVLPITVPPLTQDKSDTMLAIDLVTKTTHQYPVGTITVTPLMILREFTDPIDDAIIPDGVTYSATVDAVNFTATITATKNGKSTSKKVTYTIQDVASHPNTIDINAVKERFQATFAPTFTEPTILTMPTTMTTGLSQIVSTPFVSSNDVLVTYAVTQVQAANAKAFVTATFNKGGPLFVQTYSFVVIYQQAADKNAATAAISSVETSKALPAGTPMATDSDILSAFALYNGTPNGVSWGVVESDLVARTAKIRATVGVQFAEVNVTWTINASNTEVAQAAINGISKNTHEFAYGTTITNASIISAWNLVDGTPSRVIWSVENLDVVAGTATIKATVGTGGTAGNATKNITFTVADAPAEPTDEEKAQAAIDEISKTTHEFAHGTTVDQGAILTAWNLVDGTPAGITWTVESINEGAGTAIIKASIGSVSLTKNITFTFSAAPADPDQEKVEADATELNSFNSTATPSLATLETIAAQEVKNFTQEVATALGFGTLPTLTNGSSITYALVISQSNLRTGTPITATLTLTTTLNAASANADAKTLTSSDTYEGVMLTVIDSLITAPVEVATADAASIKSAIGGLSDLEMGGYVIAITDIDSTGFTFKVAVSYNGGTPVKSTRSYTFALPQAPQVHPDLETEISRLTSLYSSGVELPHFTPTTPESVVSELETFLSLPADGDFVYVINVTVFTFTIQVTHTPSGDVKSTIAFDFTIASALQ